MNPMALALRGLRELCGALVPFPCPLCETVTADGEHNTFCGDCLKKMPTFIHPLCPDCGGTMDTALACCRSCASQPKRSWQTATALFPHREPVKNLIHQMKYRKRPEIARAFGALAADAIRVMDPAPDLIVPVPMHWFRKLRRGYNHAALFARYAADGTGIPFADLLCRKSLIRHQMGLRKRERQKITAADFSVRYPDRIAGRRILLLDDVLTTGATLAGAAKALLNAGAAEVSVLVISRR